VEIRRALWATFLLAALATSVSAMQQAYQIGPRDRLALRVLEVPELNVERRVNEEGAISLPLLGDFVVSGLSTSEAASRLEALLTARYVRKATVSIEVIEFRASPITVIGAVRNPGPLEVAGRISLLEALTAAGGLSGAQGRVIHILRRADNGLSDQLTIDADDLLVRGDLRANIPLLSGDLVNVPVTVEVTVFCLGEVQQPGAVTFRSTERITLLAAIARAGGLSDRASKRILVKRRTDAGDTELEADYRAILAGRAPDLELQDGDVLYIKESFF
jgi:polysaccharide export outer membrane protein